MIKKILISGAFVVFAVLVCFAAAVDGLWKGRIDDQYQVALNLKADGDKLTGTFAITGDESVSANPDDVSTSPFVSAQMGSNPIADGKITGNDFTFKTTFNGNSIPYVGKIDGDKIVLTTTYQTSNIKLTLLRSK